MSGFNVNYSAAIFIFSSSGNCDMHFVTIDLTNYDTYFSYTDFITMIGTEDIIPITAMPAAINFFGLGQVFIV